MSSTYDQDADKSYANSEKNSFNGRKSFGGKSRVSGFSKTGDVIKIKDSSGKECVREADKYD